MSLIGAILIYVPESAEDCARISESPSETYEKVVRVLEIPELVAGMEIKSSCNLSLQGNDLVEFSEVGTSVYDVMADSEVNGEYRHDHLDSC